VVAEIEGNVIRLCLLFLGDNKARFWADFCVWHSWSADNRQCEGHHHCWARHGLSVDWWKCMLYQLKFCI